MILQTGGIRGPNPLGGIANQPIGNSPQLQTMKPAGLQDSYGSGSPLMNSMIQKQQAQQLPQTTVPVQSASPVQMQAPQPVGYGLSASEQALQGGLQGGLSALSQGQQQATGTLQTGYGMAQNQLGQAQNILGQNNQLAQNQLGQAINSLGGNYNIRAAQGNAANVNTGAGQGMFRQAAQGVDRFTGEGLRAQNLQGALSGSQGQAAFDAAMINNPLQNFLNQRGQEALANQAAASGGLGSGEFQADLQQLGQAQAGQQLQQQIQNLSALSGQGLQAAGQAGNFLSQGGQTQANLAAQNAQMQQQANLANAQMQQQAAMSNAQNRMSTDLNRANLLGQGAQMQNQLGMNQANLFGTGAQLAAGLTGQAAGYQNQSGINAANLFSGTGQNLASGRMQTGRDLASQIGQSTSALSQLASQQGAGTADIIGSGAANIADLMQNSGQLDAAQKSQLAQILANLSTGQGTQLSNIALGQGDAAANAALMQGQNANQLIGNLASAYGLYQGGQTPATAAPSGNAGGLTTQQIINGYNSGGGY